MAFTDVVLRPRGDGTIDTVSVPPPSVVRSRSFESRRESARWVYRLQDGSFLFVEPPIVLAENCRVITAGPPSSLLVPAGATLYTYVHTHPAAFGDTLQSPAIPGVNITVPTPYDPPGGFHRADALRSIRPLYPGSQVNPLYTRPLYIIDRHNVSRDQYRPGQSDTARVGEERTQFPWTDTACRWRAPQ